MKALPTVSKSKYMAGLQCPKLLWCHYHRKDLFPEEDEVTQAIFGQGHEVGDYAKQWFPGGIEVERDHWDFEGIVEESTQLLAKRKPLFEAGFRHAGGFARVDILDPVGRDQWDVVEVKSSTKVKDVHLEDIAFQRFIYEGAGIKVRRTRLMLVNNQYVRRGKINPRQLLKIEDVTDGVNALMAGVGKQLREMQSLIRGSQQPAVDIGPQCSAPYDCPLLDVCWKRVPEHSVFTLGSSKKAWEWYAQGYRGIKDLPLTLDFSKKQAIQIRAVRTGKSFKDPKVLREFLGELQYPLHFLDFETIGTAVPLFDHVRPYQQVPFQYSLHVVDSEGAKPIHYSFLAEEAVDPRRAFLKRLAADLGSKGSVIAYNASFETGVLKEACKVLPEFEPWRKKVETRIVDLLMPFRNLGYYHPDQDGSASMKAVLPSITGRGYDKLAIQEGETAGLRFLEMVYGNLPDAQRRKIRADLQAYCGLDTLGMVWIVDRLRELVA